MSKLYSVRRQPKHALEAFGLPLFYVRANSDAEAIAQVEKALTALRGVKNPMVRYPEVHVRLTSADALDGMRKALRK